MQDLRDLKILIEGLKEKTEDLEQDKNVFYFYGKLLARDTLEFNSKMLQDYQKLENQVNNYREKRQCFEW